MPERESHGRTDRTYDESEPWWPEGTRAPDGAPNVLMTVLDDADLGQLDRYGGLTDTPNIDRTPLAFTGGVARVDVDVSGDSFVHTEAEMDRLVVRE